MILRGYFPPFKWLHEQKGVELIIVAIIVQEKKQINFEGKIQLS